jgi:Family of unknown function (DUF6454)
VVTDSSTLGSFPTADRKTLSTELNEVIHDLVDVQGKQATSGLLVQKLLSFASTHIEFTEIAQTQLHLLNADGTRPHFRIHPQGMEIDGQTGLVYVTTAEIIEERDKARNYWGKGRAHLFECNIEGKTIRSVQLKSDNEDEYHPSGMVLVGRTMFMGLSQYGPNTSATIIKFDVKDWTYEKLFRIEDHVGLIVPNLEQEEIFLGNWGTRDYYRTDLKGSIKCKHRNPCPDNMEHQDAQLLSVDADTLSRIRPDSNFRDDSQAGSLILATGVTGGGMECFGLDLFDVTTWSVFASLRWPSAQHLMDGGWPPFVNSTFLWVDPYDRVLALVIDESTGMDVRLVLYRLEPREQESGAV